MNKGIGFNWHRIVNCVIILILMLGLSNIPTGIVHADIEESKKPIIAQGDSVLVTMDKNGTPQAFALSVSIENYEEGETFTWSISSPASHGAASVGTDGKESVVTYLPETDYVGEDEFTVSVFNQLDESDVILVKVSVLETTPTTTPEPEITPTSEPTIEPLVENSNPNFAGYINLNFDYKQLAAHGWSEFTEVTMTIDDPSNGTGIDYYETKTVNEDQTGVGFTWPSFTIKPGAIFTASGDGDTVTCIFNLAVQTIDPFHNSISGVGDPGANLVVSVNGDTRSDRHVVVAGDGTWSVQFRDKETYGFGETNPFLLYIKSGWVESTDANGNQIKIIFSPSPNISVLYSSTTRSIKANHWGASTPLTLQIDDPYNGVGFDYSEQGTTNAEGSVTFNLTGFNLSEGQLISVTDSKTTKTTMVSKLDVEEVNLDTDVVCGTTDPNTDLLEITTYDHYLTDYWYTTSDALGHWCFDFSSTTDGVDVEPGFGVNIFKADEDWDFTIATSWVFNPKIIVNVSENEITTYNWKIGDTVTLNIDDPINGTGIDYSDSQTVKAENGYAKDIYFYVNNYELAPGQLVTITNGSDSDSILIYPACITGISGSTITGTAPPDNFTQIDFPTLTKTVSFHIDVGNDGNWTLNIDYMYGYLLNGESYILGIWDSDKDVVYYSQAYKNPIIEANITSNTIQGWDWEYGKTLTLTIDDPANGAGVDFSATPIVNKNAYKPHFSVDLGQFTLAPGQTVTLTDGITNKSLLVNELDISDVNSDTDTISGTTDTYGVITSWVKDSNNQTIQRSDIFYIGPWNFDFANSGDVYAEKATFDILSSTNIYVKQLDVDGDYTQAYVIKPSFTDVPPDYSETLGGTTYNLFPYIQALVNAGLTVGTTTNPPAFSPALTLDRSMAAVFMLRGNFGTAYAPPASPWNTFTNESWANNAYAQKWAEGLYQAHLTAGCQTSPLRYCPDRTLTREEAVVFALHLKYDTFDGDGNVISSYTPPAATGTVFGDMTDTSYWGTKWAEQAYLDGLLPACGTIDGKPKFCPLDPVNRAWAAYMIVKAKNLALP